MKYIFASFIILLLIVSAFVFSPVLASSLNPQKVELVSPLASEATPSDPQLPSDKVTKNKSPKTTLEKPLNILLLGLDGRKGDKNPRCDTIHLISLKPKEEKVTLTTIPRGTLIVVSKDGRANYLANVCHLLGIDFAVSKIEKLTGTRADYIVKVGFSQAQGVLRLIGLPAAPALQFLRNRRYGIGDYQRSYNQAVFLKDTIAHLEKLLKLPEPIQYLGFKMIETDMSFEEAKKIADFLISSKIFQNPEKIELVTVPDYNGKRKEIHLTDKLAKEESWQIDPEFKEYQNNLEDYLENLIGRAEKLVERKKNEAAYKLLATPFSQKLWLQIEDSDKRNLLHFKLLKPYTLSSVDKKNSVVLLSDFIREMEILGFESLKKEAEILLSQIE